MKRLLKRFPCFAAVLFLIVVFSVSSAAIEIDGFFSNREWENSESYILKEQRTFTNGIKDAMVNVYFDSSTNGLYMILRCECKNLSDLSAAKFGFSVNGSDYTQVSFSNEVLQSPYETFSAVEADTGSDIIFAETLCYIKKGLKLPARIDIVVTDCEGIDSSVYTISFSGNYSDSGGINAHGKANQSDSASDKTKASKTGKTTVSKTKRTTTEFPFSKVSRSSAQTDETEKSEKQNAAAAVIDSGSGGGLNGRTPMVIIGAVCSLSVAAAAIYSAIRGNKINQDNDTK